MHRPWPNPRALPLSLLGLSLGLSLACSSASVEQDSANNEQQTDTGELSGTAPTQDPSTSPTAPPTTGEGDSTGGLTDSASASDPTPSTSTADPATTDPGTTGGPPDTTGTGTTGTTGDASSSTTEPVPESCFDRQKNGDETDIDCGGSCPGCAIDETCQQDGDCDSLSCADGLCVAASCDDLKQDGYETDVDCGGGFCGGCPDGGGCLKPKDCANGICDANICAAPTCSDKLKNQDESDVDCGGATCAPCADNKKCIVADDCSNKICTNSVCVAPSCSDGAQNGVETGVDCGGPACAPCQLDGLIVNEIDYDQVGTDSAEFVEIYNNTGADVDLASVHLVLVNGSNNATYLDQSLAAAGVLKQGAYLIVGSDTVVLPPGTPFVKFAKAVDNIQNGSPDGVALVDVGAKKLLDALSYKGPMTMANVTGLGVVSLVEGTALKTQVGDSNSEIGSLIRFPNGNDKNDANTEWLFSKSPTPGAANKP